MLEHLAVCVLALHTESKLNFTIQQLAQAVYVILTSKQKDLTGNEYIPSVTPGHPGLQTPKSLFPIEFPFSSTPIWQ